MATTASPYGLRPYNMVGSRPNSNGFREYAMTTNSATAIYTGDVIQLTAGQPAAMSATPTTSSAGVIGVCVGVTYVDPTLKQVMFAQTLPANAITNGYTSVKIRVVDDPDALFMLQADGSVTAASIGRNAPIANFGGSSLNGTSTVRLTSASIATTSTLAVRIVDLVVPGDTYTDCVVKFNFGVHTYYQSAGA
jgi:hypothetical protein